MLEGSWSFRPGSFGGGFSPDLGCQNSCKAQRVVVQGLLNGLGLLFCSRCTFSFGGGLALGCLLPGLCGQFCLLGCVLLVLNAVYCVFFLLFARSYLGVKVFFVFLGQLKPLVQLEELPFLLSECILPFTKSLV